RAAVIARRGYRHPDWQEAHRGLVHGRLSRVLANLMGSVIVHTDEELGLPLVEPCPRLDEIDARLLGLLGALKLKTATEEFPPLLLLVARVSDVPKSIDSPDLAAALGVAVSTVR